jgi:MFS family permease
MRLRTPSLARLAAFWFGIQMVWGALLGVSLQARAIELAGAQALWAYGVLATSGAAVAAIVQILIGTLSDSRRIRGSKRYEFYAVGGAIASGAVVWFYLARSFPELIAALVLLQIAMNVAIGPYQAVIPDYVSSDRMAAASSWMAALQSLGNAAGALTAALVPGGRFDGVAIAVVLLATCAATATHVRALTPRPVHTERLRVSRAFVDLFISRGLVFLGFYTLLGYLFFYVRESLGGSSKTTTGVLILIVTGAAAAGAAFAAKPASRADQRSIAAAGGGAFIAALIAFLLSRGFAAIVCSALGAGLSWGVFVTADWALGCRFLPKHALATSFGVWNLAQIAPQIAAPLIATGVLSVFGALHSGAAAHIAFVIAVLEVAAGVAWLRRLPAAHPAARVESAPGGNMG